MLINRALNDSFKMIVNDQNLVSNKFNTFSIDYFTKMGCQPTLKSLPFEVSCLYLRQLGCPLRKTYKFCILHWNYRQTQFPCHRAPRWSDCTVEYWPTWQRENIGSVPVTFVICFKLLPSMFMMKRFPTLSLYY